MMFTWLRLLHLHYFSKDTFLLRHINLTDKAPVWYFSGWDFTYKNT